MIGDHGHWGQRVVLETRVAVLDFLFAEVAMAKLHGGCYSNNAPAVFD